MSLLSPRDPIEREKREIERRRQRNADRAQRIHHTKTRILGVDATALDKQLQEKQDKAKQEEEEKRYYDQLTATHAKLLTEADRERARDRARREEELAFYRKEQEKEKKRRESALPDDGVAKEKTVFLDFAGVDADKARREALQKQQQQEWLAAQITRLQEKEAAQRDAERANAEQEKQFGTLLGQAEEQALSARNRQLRETQLYNQQLAADKKANQKRAKSISLQQDQQELDFLKTSPLLNEQFTSQTTRDAFKGISADEQRRILEQQLQQQREAQQRREKQKLDEAEWAANEERTRREMIRQERLKQEKERQAKLELKNTLVAQKKEHDQTAKHLKKVVYTNPVEPSFFDQFGTSHR